MQLNPGVKKNCKQRGDLLFVLEAYGFHNDGLVEFNVSFGDKRQNLWSCTKGTICSQEYIDIGRLEFARVRGKRFDKFIQSAGLDEPHSNRFPFQMANVIFRIL